MNTNTNTTDNPSASFDSIIEIENQKRLNIIRRMVKNRKEAKAKNGKTANGLFSSLARRISEQRQESAFIQQTIPSEFVPSESVRHDMMPV